MKNIKTTIPSNFCNFVLLFFFFFLCVFEMSKEEAVSQNGMFGSELFDQVRRNGRLVISPFPRQLPEHQFAIILSAQYIIIKMKHGSSLEEALRVVEWSGDQLVDIVNFLAMIGIRHKIAANSPKARDEAKSIPVS